MCGSMTKQDRIRNNNIRRRIGIAPIIEPMMETRLRWFEHVERRPVNSM